LQTDLHFRLYKPAIAQGLNNRDTVNRRISSEPLLQKLNDDAVINTALMTNFLLSVYVKKQNCRYWAPTNSQELHQRPLHSDKLTVWCGIASSGVLGPYFFEDDEDAAVTVTS
jgi:hypothetical protein